ncbi:unnamed protein product [Arabidopsis halleri]
MWPWSCSSLAYISTRFSLPLSLLLRVPTNYTGNKPKVRNFKEAKPTSLETRPWRRCRAHFSKDRAEDETHKHVICE